MFKFDGILVGNEAHRRLFNRLTQLARQGKEVEYEEYVTDRGTRRTVFHGDIYLVGGSSDVVRHEGRVVRCRGYAQP
jgi:hypothetical protein